MVEQKNLSDKRKYLARVLRMNPIQESVQILSLRNQILGKFDSDLSQPTDYEKLDRIRQKSRDTIDKIRRSMWTSAPEKLKQGLNTVDVQQVPELRPAVEKLKLVLAHHALFHRLANHPQKQINLVNTLKRIVMLPPRDSGALKESYLRQIIESPELSQIQSFVRTIESEFPPLFKMESDWFQEVIRLKARKKPKFHSDDSPESYEAGISGWVIWIGFVILFRIIAAIVRYNSQ